MIEIAREVQLSGGVAPYTYVWSTDNICASFSIVSAVTQTGKIDVVVSFQDSACVAGTTITLNATDAEGCPMEPEEITFTDICDNFVLTTITANGNYSYTVNAAFDGLTSVGFEWLYDTVLFNKVSQTNSNFSSTLVLSLKNEVNSLPESTLITAVGTAQGCRKTSTLTHSLCVPNAGALTVNLYQVTILLLTKYISSVLTLPDPAGCSSEIDWDTVQFSLPSGITLSSTSDGQLVAFTGSSTLDNGDMLTGTYTVANEEGVRSTPGTITFIVHGPKTQTIFIPNKTWTLDCDDDPGDVVELNIEDQVVLAPGATVDWSTWELVTPPTPLSSSIELSTDSEGNHVILYTIPSPIAADVFSWIVRDTDGIPAETTTYTVIDCVAPPTANDDTATVTCGATADIDVLANDLGNGSPFDLTSVQITSAPGAGSATTLVNGKIRYSAPAEWSGETSLFYRAKNTSGTWSNEAELVITVVCSGVNANVIICN